MDWIIGMQKAIDYIESNLFYRYTREDGTSFDSCGGYTKHIPGITSGDVPEILKMIKEQDKYFEEMLGSNNPFFVSPLRL